MLWLLWRRLMWRLFKSPTVIIVAGELSKRASIEAVEIVAGVPIVRYGMGNVLLLQKGGKAGFDDYYTWQPLIGRVF